MGMTIPTEIRLDFCDAKYIAVNAKQFDSGSRNILASCYNNGKFFKLNKNYHVVYMRLRRPDDQRYLHRCDINYDGKISMILNKEMIRVAGRCLADVFIFDKTYSATDSSYAGVFVTDLDYDNNGNVAIELSPEAVLEDDGDGNIAIKSLTEDGRTIAIPDDPSPFVVYDDDGRVIMASVDENGDVSIPNVSLITTMNFYVNVLPSVFHTQENL